jgi:thioredoxin-dependent peroxiredoxin
MSMRRLMDVRASVTVAVLLTWALTWTIAAPIAFSDPQPAPPEAGMAAPPFHLQDQTGAWHTLGDYRGKWLVLYFYPKDDTPGCTTQACEFRDNIFAFNKLGAVIVGISVDDVASHKQFAEEHSLPFTLLADSTKATATAYGVLRSALGIMEIASRETFIIDPNGRVAKHYAAVDPKGHSQVVLVDLKALIGRYAPN